MMRGMIQDYVGLRVTVMGLGRFGGGVGVARFLAQRGADVLVTDTLPPEELSDSVAQLAGLEAGGASGGSVSYRLGGHNVGDFTTRDLVVVNPAVKPGNRFVRAAEAAGIPVASEIRLLVKHLPNRLRTIGVTGSAGKSTTTAMIAHILRKVLGQESETPVGDWQDITPRRQDAKTPRTEFGRQLQGPGVWMGGNIGGSLLPLIEQIRAEDWVVLELSSFMLEGLRKDEWSPHVAVVTNISPNHLDWHGSMEDYVAAKSGVFEFQDTDQDCRVLNPNLDRGFKTKWSSGFGGQVLTPLMGSRIGEIAKYLRLPGKHNAVNAVLAHCTCASAMSDFASPDVLGDFCGLSHRLEYVGDSRGAKAYNDSKSTTPEAAKLAIEAFDEGIVRVVLGGYDKGSDFGDLAATAAARCAGVYTIGAVGDAIADRVEKAIPQESGRPETCGGVSWPGRDVAIERCGTLDVAVERAMRDAKPGEVLLLSPGCASWDQFANYEQRGEAFKALVRQYADQS